MRICVCVYIYIYIYTYIHTCATCQDRIRSFKHMSPKTVSCLEIYIYKNTYIHVLHFRIDSVATKISVTQDSVFNLKEHLEKTFKDHDQNSKYSYVCMHACMHVCIYVYVHREKTFKDHDQNSKYHACMHVCTCAFRKDFQRP